MEVHGQRPRAVRHGEGRDAPGDVRREPHGLGEQRDGVDLGEVRRVRGPEPQLAEPPLDARRLAGRLGAAVRRVVAVAEGRRRECGQMILLII